MSDDIDNKTPEKEMHWSQRRCLICDRYSKPGNKTINWVCDDCKATRDHKTILRMRHVSGLIAHYSKEVVEKWKEFDFAANQLYAQKEEFENLKKMRDEK